MKLPPFVTAALLSGLPMLARAQTTEFGNLTVVQNDSGNNTTSVTMTKAAGSTPNLAVRSGSTRGDFNVTFGYANDYNTGVLISSVAQNGRNNNAFGDTLGLFYSTSAIDMDSTTTPVRFYIPVFNASSANEEVNVDLAAAHFPYSLWLGGLGRNAANTNGGATDTFIGSPGIALGTQFTTAGSGVFGLNLTSINAAHTAQNGVLLVNHVKNEDNYAASKANANGTFTLYVRDNYVSGTANEQDPIAFVYVPVSDIGTKRLNALGRVNSDATTDVSAGTFSVSKGGTGQWHLSIPGQSSSTGTLIISPESGGTNNTDNIVSYQWDAANSRWVIESRDIPASGLATLEDGATGAEDMFSFAFFQAPAAPVVSITSPTNNATVYTGTAFTVDASATDADGTITQVEFLRNGTVISTDTAAPFTLAETGLPVGAYAYTARATDNSGLITTSAAVNMTVTLDPGSIPANTALYFDGVNDYVTMGTALELGVGGPPANGMTLECWFRKEGAGVTSSSGSGGVAGVPLFGKGRGESDGSNLDCDYFFGITTGGLLVADFETYPATGLTAGQNYPITATNTPISNGVWNHVAVTYDGPTATWKMYLNGAVVGTTTAAAGARPRYDSIQHFGIGTAMTSTGAREGAFAGTIDEVRVWNYARSSEEIAVMKDLAILTAPGLVGRFGLNEGTGTTTSSSAGVTAGTLTNGPLWTVGAPVTTNGAPTVTLTAPADGSSMAAPANVTLTADASDTDGSIAKVEFFVNGTEVGEDDAAPYSYQLTGLAQADYTLTAKATDNFGMSSTSAPVTLHVTPPVTTPPTVSITSPANNSSFLAPATINVTADAADTDGAVTKVEFFNGATKLGEDLASPYVFTWSNVAAGSYTLTAKATDDMTATTTSAVVTVQVVANQAPSINLTSPADAATGVGAGGSLALNASVSDPEGQPLTVTFYGREKSPAPGPDFTLMTLPDTQFYSENLNNRLTQFTSQTNWIVSSRESLNTAFVAHMGDMVNTATVDQEWVNADGAMDIIENPVTTLLTHGIPWGGAPGNHDVQSGGNVKWNQYFGTSRWSGRPYFQGNYGTNNDNNYQFFSASGLDFMVVNLVYNANTAGTQAVMDWADALLKAHPNRRAIVTSHWLVNTGNPASWGGHGQAVYDNLKDNPNLFMMLCGHVHGEGQRADTFEGRTVYTILQDYQGRSGAPGGLGGGDGWLRYYTFSPANNMIQAKTYRTTVDAFETDADSQFTLPYDMSGGSATWVPLGTVSAAGGVATLDWMGIAGATEYEWYAAVSDGTHATGSTPRTFTTAANTAPTVTLTSPADGAIIALPAQVGFTANVADADGGIHKVEFYAGATKVGEDDTAPYALNWTAISGSYALTAVAIDNQGASTTSAAVNITVTNPANVLPTVSITSPANGFTTEDTSLTINATADDADGFVAKVQFYRGLTLLGEDTTAPYSFNWTNPSVGTYNLTALAVDNDNGSTTSASVSVTFTPPGNFTGSYSQDFNAMGASGTTLPGTWTVKNAASTTGNTTWASSISASDVAAMTNVTAALTATTAPAANNLNGYNAADLVPNTSNRVLASAPTTVAGMAFQLLLTNGTGSPIDALKISFDTLRYTVAGTANELPGYWLFYSLDNGTSWTNASTLNPTISTVPNTVGTTATPQTILVLNGNWNVGAPLLLRWVDDNASQGSPDQVIGLDNVAITRTYADTDGDGIPNAWETANGTNPNSNDAGSNDDHDEHDAYAEFLFGLNPDAPDRYEWTSTPQPGTGHVTLQFPTLPGRLYRIRWSDDLSTWQNATVWIAGDGTTKSFLDDGTTTGTPPAADGSRFYVIEVVPNF
ncbi:MAG: Ig-like domain-containing protein [Verrucomicrobiota bacterium]